ncbi:MAG TPA: hypothetical protein VGM88_10800 [Kofleriaceae bacterium]
MNLKTFGMVFGLAAALAGCKKKEDAAAAKEDKGAAAAGVGGNLPDAIAAWMPKDAKAALQGSWQLRMMIRKSETMSMGGDVVAANITGDKAEIFDGKDTHNLPFFVASPCKFTFTEDKDGQMGKATYSYSQTFLIANGQAQVGQAAAGMRKGKSAIVCTDTGPDQVYTLDDKGTCTAWSFRFKDWESKPTTCTWSQENGKDVLSVGDPNDHWSPKVIADGDLLKSQQFSDEAKNFSKMDFAAAKTAATDDMHQHDPAWKAQQKGGKPGDLTTVLGIMASVNDKSIFGKETTVTGQFFSANSSTSTSGGQTQTSYFLSLVDSKDTMDITLTCELSAEAPKLTQYDKVTVKGTIGKSFGASLEKCSVVP